MWGNIFSSNKTSCAAAVGYYYSVSCYLLVLVVSAPVQKCPFKFSTVLKLPSIASLSHEEENWTSMGIRSSLVRIVQVTVIAGAHTSSNASVVSDSFWPTSCCETEDNYFHLLQPFNIELKEGLISTTTGSTWFCCSSCQISLMEFDGEIYGKVLFAVKSINLLLITQLHDTDITQSII